MKVNQEQNKIIGDNHRLRFYLRQLYNSNLPGLHILEWWCEICIALRGFLFLIGENFVAHVVNVDNSFYLLATTLTVTNDQNTKKEAKPSLEKMDHTKIFFDSSNSMDRNLVYIVSHHSCMLWNCVLSLTHLSMLKKIVLAIFKNPLLILVELVLQEPSNW